MSDDVPEIDVHVPGEPSDRMLVAPQILVFGVGAGYAGAVINLVVNMRAANVSGQNRTRLVLARTMDELNGRIVAALISEFGLSQADALALVPAGLTPIAPVSGDLPLPSDVLPAMDGTVSAGVSVDFSRGDHIHPTDTSRAPVMGVTDGSNATPGRVGEFLSASVQPGSPIAAVTNVPMDITTLVLTAGDWDLQGQVATLASSGGHIQHMQMWMSQASATVPAVLVGGFHEVGGIATGGSEQMVLPSGRMRMVVTTSTTVYLSTKVTFTGSLSAYGFISARRVR
jgi:hypothetical protein